jgi:hypothetical protein
VGTRSEDGKRCELLNDKRGYYLDPSTNEGVVRRDTIAANGNSRLAGASRRFWALRRQTAASTIERP